MASTNQLASLLQMCYRSLLIALVGIGFTVMPFAPALSPVQTAEAATTSIKVTINPKETPNEFVEFENTGNQEADILGFQVTELSDPDGQANQQDLFTIQDPDDGQLDPGTSYKRTITNDPSINNSGDTVTVYESSDKKNELVSVESENGNQATGSFQIEAATSEQSGAVTNQQSGPVTNTDSNKDFQTIQAAIDDSNTDAGDVIEVDSGDYDESLTIDKENLTLKGPNAGTAGDSDGRSAEAIISGQDSFAVESRAANVKINGFKIENPDGDRGIRATDKAAGVTIENNVVTNVNTDSDADQARGIIVGGLDGGDSANGIEIRNNKITNIEGAAADEKQVMAIQILEESNGGGLIEGVVVDGNKIEDILDTRSAVAINFNGKIEGEIKDNHISELNTEGTTPSGEPGGFTQVIALNAGGNASDGPQNVSVEDNNISNIEMTTDDNFAPPFHVIVGPDADGSTISIENNDFNANSPDSDVILSDGTGGLNIEKILNNNSTNKAVVIRENPIKVPTIFSSIQDAIGNAGTTNGDIIEVKGGTYNEDVTVDKELTLRSVSGKSSTQINGTVTVKDSNVKIGGKSSGFKITNGNGIGIDIKKTDNDTGNQISNITIRDNRIYEVGNITSNNPGDAIGIYIQGGDSIDINRNNIHTITADPDLAENAGDTVTEGILVGNDAETTPSNIAIRNNTIKDITGAPGVFGINVSDPVNGINIKNNRPISRVVANELESDDITYAVGVGFNLKSSGVNVKGNTFKSFESNGTASGSFRPVAVDIKGGEGDNLPNIKFNNFLFNSDSSSSDYGAGVEHDDPQEGNVIDATKNFWNTSQGPDVDGGQSSPGAEVDPTKEVAHSPWLCNKYTGQDNPAITTDGNCESDESQGDNTLRVCKLVVDSEGKIFDGANTNSDFSITINSATSSDADGEYATTSEFATTTTLKTPTSPNYDLFDVDNPNGDSAVDVQCKTIENLPDGNYAYSQENINPDGQWEVAQYNDGPDGTPNDLNDFAEYSDKLFDDNPDNDNERNNDSDGDIPLEDGETRTLTIKNTSKKKTCELNPDKHLSVDSFNAASGTVSITNSSTECSYDVGIASYKGFNYQNGNSGKLEIGSQELHDHATGTISQQTNGDPGVQTFDIDVPSCSYQIDVFYGDLITDFSGGDRYYKGEYGDRKIDGTASHENTDNLCTLEDTNEAQIVAQKVVCDTEADLPDWQGTNKAKNIDAQTAQQYVDKHQACSLNTDWQFQWAPSSFSNEPGDEAATGTKPSPWSETFSGTTTIDLDQLDGDTVSVREVLQDGYIPFTFSSDEEDNSNNETAEFYCSGDGVNYDNLERVENLEKGQTAHCVGFNAPEPPEEPELLTCSDTEQEITYIDVSDDSQSEVYGLTPSGNASTKQAFNGDFHSVLAADENEVLYGIRNTGGDDNDTNQEPLVTFSSSGTTTEVGHTGLPKPVAMNFAPTGELYVADQQEDQFYEVDPSDGSASTAVGNFSSVQSQGVRGGDLVVNETNHLVYLDRLGYVYQLDLNTGDWEQLDVVGTDDPNSLEGDYTSLTYVNGFYYALDKNGNKVDKFEIGDFDSNGMPDNENEARFISSSPVNEARVNFGDATSCLEPPAEESTGTVEGVKFEDDGQLGVFNGTDNERLEGWQIIALGDESTNRIADFEVDSGDEQGENPDATVTGLDSGEDYLVISEGTYSFAEEEGSVADAEYSSRNNFDDRYKNANDRPDITDGSVNDGVLDLVTSENPNPNWGDYSTSSQYSIIDNASGSSVDFYIDDTNYDDNSGSLDVRVYKLDGFSTTTDPDGEYELELPEGMYEIVEVLQDGYEQTYRTEGADIVEVAEEDSPEVINFGNDLLDPEDDNEDVDETTDENDQGSDNGESSRGSEPSDGGGGGGALSPGGSSDDGDGDDEDEGSVLGRATSTDDADDDADVGSLLGDLATALREFQDSLDGGEVAGVQDSLGFPDAGEGSLNRVAQADTDTENAPADINPTENVGTSTTDSSEASTSSNATSTATSSEDNNETATTSADDDRSGGFGWGFWVALIGFIIVAFLLYRSANGDSDNPANEETVQ